MQLAAPKQGVLSLELPEFITTDPRQSEYNQMITANFGSRDQDGRERIEDTIKFATWIQPSLVGVTVLVSSEPFFRIEGKEDGKSFSINVSQGNSCFSVNGSSFVSEGTLQENFSVSRQLLTAWRTLIGHLPEGFIMYGPDVDPSSSDFPTRERILQGLGFGPTSSNGNRFGVIRNNRLTPLTNDGFVTLTGTSKVGDLFQQRFMVEEIIWPTQE